METKQNLNYIIAAPWTEVYKQRGVNFQLEKDHLCVFTTANSQVHYGTIEEAEALAAAINKSERANHFRPYYINLV